VAGLQVGGVPRSRGVPLEYDERFEVFDSGEETRDEILYLPRNSCRSQLLPTLRQEYDVAISGQPVISRETRRLLITVLVAVTALWVLARIRFQERPASSTPVPNVLAQLRPASSYADLARTIADMRPLITAAVSASTGGAPSLRISETSAVTLLPGSADTAVAFDRATGLAIVPHPHGDIPGLMPWVPRLLDYPRYLVAADVTRNHVALRPVFIGGLFPVASPLWSGEIWLLPAATPITPGTFVFTTEGAFAGVGVSHEGHAAIVPATVLHLWVERLQQPRTAGALGISVQPLSPSLASATGALAGVVVTSYTDEPVGEMAEDDAGGGRFSAVLLRPTVTVSDASMAEVASSLHAVAHDGCFIAASVSFPVTHSPTTLVAPAAPPR